MEQLVEELLTVPSYVMREVFADNRYDDTAELRSIDSPTLLLWGDADTLVTREIQETLAASIPETELVIYEGIGHTPRWEDPCDSVPTLPPLSRDTRTSSETVSAEMGNISATLRGVRRRARALPDAVVDCGTGVF